MPSLWAQCLMSLAAMEFEHGAEYADCTAMRNVHWIQKSFHLPGLLFSDATLVTSMVCILKFKYMIAVILLTGCEEANLVVTIMEISEFSIFFPHKFHLGYIGLGRWSATDIEMGCRSSVNVLMWVTFSVGMIKRLRWLVSLNLMKRLVDHIVYWYCGSVGVDLLYVSKTFRLSWFKGLGGMHFRYCASSSYSILLIKSLRWKAHGSELLFNRSKMGNFLCSLLSQLYCCLQHMPL